MPNYGHEVQREIYHEAGIPATSGVIVSNHGGRHLDGAVAALNALPGVVDVVKERAPVLMDSGIRRGADVVKALALGATAVLVGRPEMPPNKEPPAWL